jgi:cytoskeletal protein CcmA (bactofilin family)
MTITKRAWTIALLAGIAVLAAPSAAGAQERAADEEFIVLTGTAEVPEGRTVESVVIFDGPATIDGTVAGEVLAFNGPITVSGTVTGEVVAFNGLVTVRSGAEVGGDVLSRRQPVIEEGATVRGEIRSDFQDLFQQPFPFFGYIAAWLAVSVSTLLLGLLVLWLTPRAADAISEAWRSATWPSVGWGLLLLIGLPILAVLLFVTLVGIPFAVGLGLALFLIFATGYTMAGVVVGRWVVKAPRSRFAAFLAGWAILRGLALIPFVAGIVGFVAVVIGLGAMVVAIWRARRPVAATATTPA